MCRESCWLAASLVVLTIGASGPGREAKGSGLASPWSGASASVTYDDKVDARRGPTASASAGGSSVIQLQTPGWGGQEGSKFSVQTKGEVGASAGTDPAHLLHVNATYQTPGVGVSYYVLSGNDGVDVKAAWANDAVVVAAPPGSALPDVIRLNFALTFNTPGTVPTSTLTLTANGKTDTLNYQGESGLFSHWNSIRPDSPPVLPLDSSTPPSRDRVDSSTDTFHLDLPLDKAGRSAPFNLELALDPPVGAIRTPGGWGYRYADMAGNLALTGVTMPDGTALDSIGASVTFDSGLGSANAVPEPSALALWTLAVLGGVGGWIRRRRAA